MDAPTKGSASPTSPATLVRHRDGVHLQRSAKVFSAQQRFWQPLPAGVAKGSRLRPDRYFARHHITRSTLHHRSVVHGTSANPIGHSLHVLRGDASHLGHLCSRTKRDPKHLLHQIAVRGIAWDHQHTTIAALLGWCAKQICVRICSSQIESLFGLSPPMATDLRARLIKNWLHVCCKGNARIAARAFAIDALLARWAHNLARATVVWVCLCVDARATTAHPGSTNFVRTANDATAAAVFAIGLGVDTAGAALAQTSITASLTSASTAYQINTTWLIAPATMFAIREGIDTGTGTQRCTGPANAHSICTRCIGGTNHVALPTMCWVIGEICAA